MRPRISLILVCLAVTVVLLPGCSSNGGGPKPPPVDPYALPASGGFSMRLYTENPSLSVNKTFDVKVAFYQLSGALGTAFEISYPSDRIQITMSGDEVNPNYFQGATLGLGPKVEPERGLLSYAVSYPNAAPVATQSNDGVILLLHCRALQAGPATMSLVRSTFEIRRPDGSPMVGSADFRLGDLTVQVTAP
jgi:hypothetical protein